MIFILKRALFNTLSASPGSNKLSPNAENFLESP
jgi:hypothetical protein